MKTFVWIFFALAALFWTGTAAAITALAEWLAQGMASGTNMDLARLAHGWVLPAWMAPWVSPDLVAVMQDATLALVKLLEGLGPTTATVVGWLVPLVWIVWGLGVILLLVLAGIFHGLAHLMRTPTPAAPRPG